MKKRPILALACLILISLLLAAPYLLERRPLQDRLLGYLEQTFHCRASVGAISWRWLPVPALTISQLRAEAEAFSLTLPEARLILNPNFLIYDEISLSYARLIKPNLIIKPRQPEATLPEVQTDSILRGIGLNPALAGTITRGRFSFVDGTMSLPSQKINDDLTLQAVSMSGINGSVRSRADSLKVDLRASSSFAHSLSIKGDLALQPERSRFDFATEGLDSRQLIYTAPPPAPEVCAVSSLAPDSPLPVVSDLNVAGHFEGDAGGRLQLEISSHKGPFTLQWHTQDVQIEKVGSLTLERQHNAFSIDIKELSLAEPRLLLNGRIAWQAPDHTVSDPQPQDWTIDLHSANIDLGAVRSAVLNMFKTNSIAQKVCAIVGGGRAARASYSFHGGRADFNHLNSMRIWADAIDVPITLPGIGLNIDRASGPITITNGQLSGEHLSATIDKSHGTNGKILLDLGHDQHAFQLDLDLDTDLQNLRDALAQIIPSTQFQSELGRFGELKGRARGHLHLGDDLRQLKTEVDVQTVEASGIYDRLPWPFTIDSGRLLLVPEQLDWEDMRATLGNQRISRTTGTVTWQNAIHATVKDLDADLDLKSLFEEGNVQTNKATMRLRDFLHGRIEELSGQAQLHNSSFSGPIHSPNEWQYHTSINCRDLQLMGDNVPALHSQGVEADISQQQADFSGIFTLLDHEIFLSGHYQHSFFDNWQGDLEINGDFDDELGEWLKEKQIIPAATFPKLPFRLEKFVLTNLEPGFDFILARGTLIPLSQTNNVTLQVSINRQANQTINTLTFMNGDRQGSLNYQAWPEQGRRSLLTWQGELSAETLDLLYPQNFLASGMVNGTFSRLADQNTATYSGSLEATGIRFSPESLMPALTIDTLRLLGNDNTITIGQADLALAEVPATISGRVTEENEIHTLDLKVKAPQLSWNSIQKVFEVYSTRAAAGEHGKSTLDALRGTVKFDINAFDYTRQVKSSESTGGEEESHTYTATPFTGSINLKPAGIEMLISQSKVCGISGQGTWYFGDETNDNALTFSSGNTPLSFEETLPCLGFKQSLIIGPLTLDGQISGRPKQWRRGTITLSSPEGLVKRMTLLSKIFTAVNVTDYFTWQDLPDMQEEGLSYNELKLKAHIDNNNLVLDRTVIKGKGVNLSGRGTINLTDLDSDLTFFIAPFKTLDWLVSNLPLVGKALAGPKESILTFPVAVTGNLKSPEVTSLAPEAIGSAVLELFGDAVTLPFRIFQPEPEPTQDVPLPSLKKSDQD